MEPRPADAADDLVTGLGAWLAHARPAAAGIASTARPSDGLSSDTVVVTLADGDRFVVRRGPHGPGAFPEYDLAAQLEAQRLAAAGGVPVAEPAELVADERWIGSPFLVLPFVDGRIPGSVPVSDPWLRSLTPEGRRAVYDAFVDVLSAVHAAPIGGVDRVPRRDLDAELGYWERYLSWYADGDQPLPGLADALAWCRTNRPPRESAPVLLWGDVRLGNVVFGEDGEVRAVLDWEMATIGSAEHDVAWWRALEAVQDEMFGRRLDGFPSLDEALDRYERARSVTLHDLPWFEVFALVRSIAVMTRLAVLAARAGQPLLFPVDENPLLPLVQRRISALA